MFKILTEEKVKQEIIRNTLLLAIIGFVVSQALSYMALSVDNMLASWGIYMLVFGVSIFLSFFFTRRGVVRVRDRHWEGLTTFGKAFIIGLAIAFLAMLIQTLLYFILLLAFKESFDSMTIGALEKGISYMQENNVPEDNIDDMYEAIEKVKSTTAFEGAIDVFFKGAIFSVVIALLTAAFVKKDKTIENGLA